MARRKKESFGKCLKCGEKLTEKMMCEHILRGCIAPGAADSEKKIYYIEVRDSYLPEYWLMLAVAEVSELKDIDTFLRNIWLECCGHLSSFDIYGSLYDSEGASDDFFNNPNMNKKIKSVLKEGYEFSYTYDFGSSTELDLKVLAVRKGMMPKNKRIELLAANIMPEAKCKSCKKPAIYVCPFCSELLCEECSNDHECCDGYMEDVLLPIVNSPRSGVCAYCSKTILDTLK